MASIERENEAIKQRMQQSDAVLCTHLEYLHFSTKKQDDLSLISSMTRALPMTIRNVDEEYAMWTQSYATRVPSCPPNVLARGGNAPSSHQMPLCGGYECLTSMYNNTMVQKNTKHLFENATKRKQSS